MTFILKQSTAATLLIGPFVDSTDGATPETALTIANTDIRLSKNGANIAAKNSGGGTHDENGMYTITLDTTDTNTVGLLQLSVKVAGALSVWHQYQVIEEAIYDALFAAAATGLLPANVTQWNGTNVAVPTTGGIPRVALEQAADFAQAAADKVWLSAARTLTAFSTALALSVWDVLEAAVATASSMGVKVKTNLDAAITSRSSHSAADIWAVATRLLTAGTNIVLAKGVGITGLNDLSAAQVNAEVVDTLATDTYAEPAQGTPAATTNLSAKIGYLYKAFRNRNSQTATQYSLYADDAVTVDQKATVSDDGTTTDTGELATGP
jgi:hypothetical protein